MTRHNIRIRGGKFKMTWECPRCGHLHPDYYPDCPICGVRNEEVKNRRAAYKL